MPTGDFTVRGDTAIRLLRTDHQSHGRKGPFILTIEYALGEVAVSAEPHTRSTSYLLIINSGTQNVHVFTDKIVKQFLLTLSFTIELGSHR